METKYLKIGLILIICIILIFVLIKLFLPRKPIQPPPPPPPPPILSAEEVAVNYLSNELDKNRVEAEKYLLSDRSKVEIFGENYQVISSSFIGKKPESGKSPEYQIKNIKVEDGKTEMNIEVTTNEAEGSIFFTFLLPKKLVLDITFAKEGDNWKITEINAPDLIIKSTLENKVELKENVFVRPINIGVYKPAGIKAPTGSKFLSLEVEYENKTNDSVVFSPLTEWRLIDINKEVYYPVFKLITNRGSNETSLETSIIVKSGEKKELGLFSTVPEDSQIEELVFKNLTKKIIFSID